MTTIRRGDADLHNPDGSHIGTARTANGRDLERHERRIRGHLEEHKLIEAEQAAKGLCPYINWGDVCLLPAGHDGDHDRGKDASERTYP